MIQATSRSMVQAATSVKDSDGDNDGSKAKAAAPSNSFGPAVALSLSNVAKDDMAQGDPDHDGH